MVVQQQILSFYTMTLVLYIFAKRMEQEVAFCHFNYFLVIRKQKLKTSILQMVLKFQ